MPSGYAVSDLGGLTVNISQGHNSVFDFFSPHSVLKEKAVVLEI